MTLFEQYAAHVDHALDALVASKTLPRVSTRYIIPQLIFGQLEPDKHFKA